MFPLSVTAHATTYVNATTTFNWVDATAHTQVGYNMTPREFDGTISSTCGTTPPAIDDSISDIILIGFNFVFGDKVFGSFRRQSNGRIKLVSATLPLDNTTCAYGGPVTQLPIPKNG
jgi:MSHA biogenesis protein MshQ